MTLNLKTNDIVYKLNNDDWCTVITRNHQYLNDVVENRTLLSKSSLDSMINCFEKRKHHYGIEKISVINLLKVLDGQGEFLYSEILSNVLPDDIVRELGLEQNTEDIKKSFSAFINDVSYPICKKPSKTYIIRSVNYLAELDVIEKLLDREIDWKNDREVYHLLTLGISFFIWLFINYARASYKDVNIENKLHNSEYYLIYQLLDRICYSLLKTYL